MRQHIWHHTLLVSTPSILLHHQCMAVQVGMHRCARHVSLHVPQTRLLPVHSIFSMSVLQMILQASRKSSALASSTAARQEHGAADGLSLAEALHGDCNKGQVMRGDLDHWMLPQASGIQRSTLHSHAPSIEGNSTCALWSPKSNMHTPRCKGTKNTSGGYASGTAWEQPGRVRCRVADPELTAVLKPETGHNAVGVQSDLLSQGNQICGMLFDKQKLGNRSGLQYTLGGADCTFSGKAAAWDASGKEKASHHRFHRPRR